MLPIAHIGLDLHIIVLAWFLIPRPYTMIKIVGILRKGPYRMG